MEGCVLGTDCAMAADGNRLTGLASDSMVMVLGICRSIRATTPVLIDAVALIRAPLLVIVVAVLSRFDAASIRQ